MDARAVEDRYLRTNKVFGQLVGIWPDQSKSTKYIRRLGTLIIIMSANVTQVAKLLMSFSFNSITEQLPFLIMGFGTLFKQYNYVIHESKLKELLGGIVADWLADRSKEELMILEMYFKRAKHFSSFYKATAAFTFLMFAVSPAVPPILDITVPLNESRKRLFMYPAYYFFLDENRYYYFILFHMYFTSCIVAFIFIAADMNLVYSVQHACALFTISGYRFKTAIGETLSQSEKTTYGLKDKHFENMRKSIQAHKQAFQYTQIVEDCHMILSFLAVVLSMITLAVTLMQVSTMDMSVEYVSFCMFIFGQLVHLFFLNIMGQYIVDSNEETSNTMYEGHWYNGSKKSQLLHILSLQRCLYHPKLTGGKIVHLNLITFLQIVKASFSYYGLLKTV